MLYFGTSGFSYDDWVGLFYPPGMPKREWLAYYAREFNAVEINATYYTIPFRGQSINNIRQLRSMLY